MSGRLRLGKYSLRIGTVSCFTLGLSGTVCVGIGAVAPPGAGDGLPPPRKGSIRSLGMGAGPWERANTLPPPAGAPGGVP